MEFIFDFYHKHTQMFFFYEMRIIMKKKCENEKMLTYPVIMHFHCFQRWHTINGDLRNATLQNTTVKFVGALND